MLFYTQFKGTKCDLYNQNKQLIRRFNLKSNIVTAQISQAGQETFVAITCSNGKTYLYKSNGQLIRQ